MMRREFITLLGGRKPKNHLQQADFAHRWLKLNDTTGITTQCGGR
jgi:hypothetical protein